MLTITLELVHHFTQVSYAPPRPLGCLHLHIHNLHGQLGAPITLKHDYKLSNSRQA